MDRMESIARKLFEASRNAVGPVTVMGITIRAQASAPECRVAARMILRAHETVRTERAARDRAAVLARLHDALADAEAAVRIRDQYGLQVLGSLVDPSVLRHAITRVERAQ